MLKMTMNKAMTRLAALVAVLLTVGISNATAGLIEVDQTIWGMDCAPCAYGMEKGLKKLEGVNKVKVSLNKGNAVLQFATDNKLSLADIRRVVRDGGFTPKQATVKISGTLQRDGDQLRLHVGEGDYTLKPSEKAKDACQGLQEAGTGATVTVVGDAPADDQILVRKVTQSEIPNKTTLPE
jgi:copper chaperone CopZ